LSHVTQSLFERRPVFRLVRRQFKTSLKCRDARINERSTIFRYLSTLRSGLRVERANTVSLKFLFHFVRRILEILFVNSYSRPTPLCALLTIALLYGGAATSCAFFQVHTLGQLTSKPIFMLGFLVFAFSELLNGYHHWLLARLRPPGVRTYGVPRGGLFGWVASPHYLGEILSFIGYAMMSDLLPVWGNALVVSAYLASRANTTLKWYQREMPLRIPSGLRRLLPFAY
jgi:hypothetical protein